MTIRHRFKSLAHKLAAMLMAAHGPDARPIKLEVGCPPNLTRNTTHATVVIANSYQPFVSTHGNPVMAKVPARVDSRQPSFPVMLHRGVDKRVFKAQVSAARRRQLGKPDCTPRASVPGGVRRRRLALMRGAAFAGA